MKLCFQGLEASERSSLNKGVICVWDAWFRAPSHTKWITQMNFEENEIVYIEQNEPGVEMEEGTRESFYPLNLAAHSIDTIEFRGKMFVFLFMEHVYQDSLSLIFFNQEHSKVHFKSLQPTVHFFQLSSHMVSISGQVINFHVRITVPLSFLNLQSLVCSNLNTQFYLSEGIFLSTTSSSSSTSLFNNQDLTSIDARDVNLPSMSTSSFEDQLVETSRMQYVRTQISIPQPTQDLSRFKNPCTIAVCTRGVANALLKPCGHIVACLECLESMRSVQYSTFQCPLCRMEIIEVVEATPPSQCIEPQNASLRRSKRQRR
jgi:hypothetical protein